MKRGKIKLGIFSFTCCEGCVVSFLEVLNSKFFEYKDKIEIVYCRALRPVKKIGKIDIAFVEGAISTKSEINKLKEIRKNAKKLVAIGSGAINGWPSNLRNDFNSEKQKKLEPVIKKLGQIKKVLPAKEVVKFDDEIPGCPVEEKIFIKKIGEFLKNA